MEKIGLVTVLYNSNDLLEDFFASIACQDHTNFIIYLVDNTPGEETRQVINWLTQQHNIRNIIHIENTKNLGAAEGNNIGISAALKDGCEYVLMCNNDIYFTDAQLFSGLVSIAKNTGAAITAPKIYYANSNTLWYAGGSIIRWQAAVMHFGNTKEDSVSFDKSGYTGYAPTTFVLLKANIFDSVTEMDPTYFIYAEDLDFMYRALDKGYKIWYEASLSVYHKVSSTTGGIFSNTGLYYNTRNRIYFAKKFYNFFFACTTIVYVGASLLRHAALQKRKGAVKAFFKGFFDGLAMRVAK